MLFHSLSPNPADDRRFLLESVGMQPTHAVSQPQQVYELEAEAPDKTVTNTDSRGLGDLVRLYLQDIGRVPLLKKGEEIAMAREVQRYLALLKQLTEAAEGGDEELLQLMELTAVRDRLTARLGRPPALEAWSQALGMDRDALEQALANGKRRWAEIGKLEVKELENIEKAGIRAKKKMLQANLRLVVSVAKKYQNRGLELLDLIQEGTLGLERAVEKFDPTQGYRFSTYAYWWIRQGITRAIATQSRLIRLPVHMTEKLNKIKQAQREISQEKGRSATVEEVAQALEITPAQVREVLRKVPRSVSLEIKVGKEKDTELLDLLESEGETPEDRLLHEALRHDLQQLLADLTHREREVIWLRYGFKDGIAYSLADIGEILALSRERVRQIEVRALQKLRQPRRRNLVRDYFEALNQ